MTNLLRRTALALVAVLSVAGCAYTPSTVLTNDQGEVYRCAAYGIGVYGILTARGIHNTCVADLRRAEYVPLPPVALGVEFPPGSTTVARLRRETGEGRAGLLVGDHILWVGQTQILRYLDLLHALQDLRPGDMVTVVVHREGQYVTVPVMVQAR